MSRILTILSTTAAALCLAACSPAPHGQTTASAPAAEVAKPTASPHATPTADAASGAPSVLGSGTFVADDGRTIQAVYTSDEKVTLTLPDGATTTLTQAVSGSGIRFVSGDFEWVEHQGEGTYAQGDKTIFVGKARR